MFKGFHFSLFFDIIKRILFYVLDLQTYFIFENVLFPVLGGVALLLYGMRLMSQGLIRTAGRRLKISLKTLTKNRFFAIVTGIITTIAVQRSSVIMVMTVSFLNASLISLEQAIGIIFGSNIGTSVTAQLLAFNIQSYSLPAIVIGVVFVFFSKTDRMRSIGNIFLGFGMLFYGLSLMQTTLEPIKNEPAIYNAFLSLRGHPFLTLLGGTAFTMVIQSSAAAIGITLALAVSGLIDYETALLLVLGLNIGKTLTANLAAINGNPSARRAARVHFVFNLIGAVIFFILLPFFLQLVDFFTPSGEIARKVVNAHTIFNVVNVILLYPFIPLLAKLSTYLVPDSKDQESSLNYLDDEALSNPSTALDRVDLALTDMSHLTIQSLQCVKTYASDSNFDFGAIHSLENTIDTFQEKIIDYIGGAAQHSLSSHETRRIPSLVNIVNSLEKIGDFSYRMAKIMNAAHEETHGFTPSELKTLRKLFGEVIDLLSNVKKLLQGRHFDMPFRSESPAYHEIHSQFFETFRSVHKNIRSFAVKYKKKYQGQEILRTNYFIHILGLLDDLAFKCRNIVFILINKHGVETDEY